jgi:hypothetical protein
MSDLDAPEALYVQRMTRVDGCPQCATNYSLPRAVIPAADEGFTAAYHCEDCGHYWITNWGDH